MPDIIQVLPDAIANQIAAGEVIQRPASIIKELVENSVDAGSTSIHVIVKDSGKTLVQVIDNGSGMSETDARMSFERHATSKIRKADDLFSIRTMGFRGEALASIAAVAHVELRTKKKDDELGTFLYISASEVIKQEPVNCQIGSNFSVFNLFFNIPARRKFLKTNSTELKHIITEFQRVALANPNVAFSLQSNGTEIFNLPISNIKQRIVNIFGKAISTNLIPFQVETTITKIQGYIGKPEFAKKHTEEQFFFVNKRFIKQAYLHKSIMLAYEQILPVDCYPSYFVYFDIDPKFIDINIHPTKTEINFEDASTVFQILKSAVKEALGKFNIVPSIDFDQSGAIPIPIVQKNTEVKYPVINVNPQYNPFDYEKKSKYPFDNQKITQKDDDNLKHWEKLYSNFEKEGNQSLKQNQQQTTLPTDNQNTDKQFQFKGKYIMTPVKSGLMIINQKWAHERILYENLMNSIKTEGVDIQQLLYPLTLELNSGDFALIKEIINDIRKTGIDIETFSQNTIVINGLPAQLGECDAKQVIESIIDDFKNVNHEIQLDINEKIAKSMAKASAIGYGKILTNHEMREIIDNLFACKTPNYSPDGKKVLVIISNDELDKKFA